MGVFPSPFHSPGVGEGTWAGGITLVGDKGEVGTCALNKECVVRGGEFVSDGCDICGCACWPALSNGCTDCKDGRAGFGALSTASTPVDTLLETPALVPESFSPLRGTPIPDSISPSNALASDILTKHHPLTASLSLESSFPKSL